MVRAPCHGGVLYCFDIDGMLLDFFMIFLYIYIFSLLSFSFLFYSRFMLFPTFVEQKFPGGGGDFFSFHFAVLMLFQNFLLGGILKSAPSLTG